MIFGTGSFAEIVHFYLNRDSPHEVAAFTVHEHELTLREYLNLPVVPFESLRESYPPETYAMYVAIGYRDVNRIRAGVYDDAKAAGYELVTYVSSKATHWDAHEIGDNCFILEDNTIQPFVKIGNDVVMWSGNHIGHSAEIGDHCFISSHVVVSGYTKIGAYSFLGVNSTFRDSITVAESNIVSAGATVMRDTKPYQVHVGPRATVLDRRSDEIGF